ncbi:hypothetical protein [Mesorhizobium sp. M0933]|uniref:hypothetical protein n=1 Tax=Mesorhizobium sp. M0933 TaxID=2957030 RepID=UPI00333708C5
MALMASYIDAQSAAYREAWASGDPTIAAIMIGEAAGLIHDIEPASDILLRTVSEAITLLQGASSLLFVEDNCHSQ